MPFVGVELCLWKNFFPIGIVTRQEPRRSVRLVACVDRACVRIISFEMICVDFNFFDCPSMTELHNDPIIPGAPPALGFPSVAHVCRSSRHEKIVHRTEKHIAARKGYSAVLDCRKIDKLTL